MGLRNQICMLCSACISTGKIFGLSEPLCVSCHSSTRLETSYNTGQSNTEVGYVCVPATPQGTQSTQFSLLCPGLQGEMPAKGCYMGKNWQDYRITDWPNRIMQAISKGGQPDFSVSTEVSGNFVLEVLVTRTLILTSESVNWSKFFGKLFGNIYRRWA